MGSFQSVLVHSSWRSPLVQRALVSALRGGVVPGRMLYESARQSARWLDVANAWSPCARGRDYREVYLQAGKRARAVLAGDRWSLLGVGCGDGRKELDLLIAPTGSAPSVAVPMDISLPLVLGAAASWTNAAPGTDCRPVLADFALLEDDCSAELTTPDTPRLITFFGMLPNFQPRQVLPRLRRLLRAGDVLILSANLAPGENYASGVDRVLPQYDNLETRRWLTTLLTEAGWELDPGELVFRVADETMDSVGLKRIEAVCRPPSGWRLPVGEDAVEFDGERELRLFASYRYQPENLRAVLRSFQIGIEAEFVSADGEEGVFVCRTK